MGKPFFSFWEVRSFVAAALAFCILAGVLSGLVLDSAAATPAGVMHLLARVKAQLASALGNQTAESPGAGNYVSDCGAGDSAARQQQNATPTGAGLDGSPQWVVALGAGSRQCVAGDLCSFVLTLAPEAHWNVSYTKPFQWDLMVTLIGPSIIHVVLQEASGPAYRPQAPARAFLATYRAWDAGEYSTSVANPCFSVQINDTLPKELIRAVGNLGSWKVTVLPRGLGEPNPPAPEEGQLQRDALGMPLGFPALGASEEPFPLGLDPCSQTLGARWLRVGGGYEWVPFAECGAWAPLESVASGLAALGLREVAFVGDSHLRFLLLHSLVLLTGSAPANLVKAHSDFVAELPLPQEDSPGTAPLPAPTTNQSAPPSNSTQAVPPGQSQAKSIRLSFYWVDGVFRNGEFGCASRGTYSGRTDSFPVLKGRPDVAVMDSSAWSVFRCTHPALAYPAHLNEFLADVGGQLRALNCSRMMFHGAMPSANCQSGAPYLLPNFRVTNSVLRFLSEFARTQVQHHGIRFFPTWEVAAPRFWDRCQPWDPHYSCPAWPKPPANYGLLTGPVGAALARTFLQSLLTSLQEEPLP